MSRELWPWSSQCWWLKYTSVCGAFSGTYRGHVCLTGTEWRGEEGWQGEETHHRPFLWAFWPCLRMRAVWSAPATLHSFLKAAYSELDLNLYATSSWENPSVMYPKHVQQLHLQRWPCWKSSHHVRLMPQFLQSVKHRFVVSAARMGVAEWHFSNDRWTHH